MLNQLDPGKGHLDALEAGTDLERAAIMIAIAKDYGVPEVVGPSDIIRGNPKVNSVFVAELFDTWHRSRFEQPVVEDVEEEEKKEAVPKKASYEESSSSGSEARIGET